MWLLRLATSVPASAGDVFVAAGAEKNCSQGTDLPAHNIAEVFARIGFEPGRTGNFYFVTVSDTHIYEDHEFQPSGAHPVFSRDTAGSMGRLIAEIKAMAPRPAFVVMTGDLVHSARNGQFRRFRALLESLNPAVSVHLCLGNHDADRQAFQSVFPDRPPYYVFRHGAWRFLVLDSGKEGRLDDVQGQWLRGLPREGDSPSRMAFVHYPLLPYYTNENLSALSSAIVPALASGSRERWVFSGHWHANFMVRIGTNRGDAVNQVVTTASTTSFGYEIAGYRLVCVEGDHVVATVYRRVDGEGYRLDPLPAEWPVFIPPPG